VLDGWWAEGYDGDNGWAIPPSAHDQSSEERDRQDATTLYEILQDEVVPLYYDRDEKLQYSPGWVEMCKRAMVSALPSFNMQRVLLDYVRCFYAPAAKQHRALSADTFAVARDLAAWKARVRAAWPGVALRSAASPPAEIAFSDSVSLAVDVDLNGLTPADVRVECVLSREMGSELSVPVKQFAETRRKEEGIVRIGEHMVLLASFTGHGEEGGTARYRLELEPPWAGALSYEIRAVPSHPHLTHPYELGLMRRL
jgi:starch phosphorylase